MEPLWLDPLFLGELGGDQLIAGNGADHGPTGHSQPFDQFLDETHD
jgi:hypothetical protein